MFLYLKYHLNSKLLTLDHQNSHQSQKPGDKNIFFLVLIQFISIITDLMSFVLFVHTDHDHREDLGILFFFSSTIWPKILAASIAHPQWMVRP